MAKPALQIPATYKLHSDTAVVAADLWICVADPLRLGHELTYYPGNVNFKAADVILINKANTASKASCSMGSCLNSVLCALKAHTSETMLNVQEAVNALKARAAEHNPSAMVVVTSSVVAVDDEELVVSKRVVTVDDGPTLTHGGMPTGAGALPSSLC